MKKIHLKLVRDVLASKGLFLAVTAIVFLAVAFFGAMFMSYQNLSESYEYSYEKLNFADLTVKTAGDASPSLQRLKATENVEAVTGRMNADFALTLPEEAGGSAVLARAISLPAFRDGTAIVVNDVLVTEGSYFIDDQSLLIEKNFADYHHLEPGQVLTLAIGGQQVPFTIAGIAASPEYIFPAKSRQEIFVSPETWGVIFVPDNLVSTLFNRPINELCLLLSQNADRDTVINEVRNVLEPYRVMEVVEREDQPSNAGLNMDLEQFATLSEVFPLLFIIVGALAIYILLTRIVLKERTQIGLMRAVGYTRSQVMLHYAGFALMVGAVGSAVGTAAGYFLSEVITHFYAGMINLPYTVTGSHWMTLGEGFFLGLAPCVVAGLIPAWSAARLLPAAAMRPPAPSTGRRLLMEKLFPFLQRLSSLWKLPLRNIFRNRRRSLYTAVGIVFGVSLILVSAGMIDSMYDLISFQFNDIQRYDARIDFAEGKEISVVEEVSGWDGVQKVEPLMEAPALLQSSGKDYATLIRAMPEDATLYGLYSPSRHRVHPPSEGILVSHAVGDELGISPGDIVLVATTGGASQVKVAGFVKEPMGSFAYSSLGQMQLIQQTETDLVSGLLVSVVPQVAENFREKAYDIGAASVELTSETKGRVDEMMNAGIAMLWLMLLFGAVLALAIVFTTVTVNIMERRREYATMRTLGESNRRIAAMITIENVALGIWGLLPGMALGYVLALYFFSLFQGDMFTMDLVIYPRTYVMTVGIVMAIMVLSQLPGIRSLNRLNLAQVVKEQAT